MGHRLSKIVTRTGDNGTTGLGDGTRVPKYHARMHAMGDVDELNSCIGMLLCEPLPACEQTDLRAMLLDIQHDLLDLGGELSTPGFTLLKPERVEALEAHVIALNAELSPLKEFILPGGTRTAALAHIARTVCRRAERAVVVIGKHSDVDGDTQPASDCVRQYLNRLSDLMFVLARSFNRLQGTGDVLWQRKR